MSKGFHNAVKERRSIYGITHDKILSDDEIEEIIHLAVAHTPTAFNSQTGRIVVLLGEQSQAFWALAFDTVKADLATEKIISARERFDGFAAGYGTVLFFEDDSVVKSFQEKFPSVREHFPIWSQQSSGMLQYIVWTALEHEGFGASLQHYDPEVSKGLKASWGIQENWTLIAQLPFGKPVSPPKEKVIQPVENRVVIVR